MAKMVPNAGGVVMTPTDLIEVTPKIDVIAAINQGVATETGLRQEADAELSAEITDARNALAGKADTVGPNIFTASAVGDNTATWQAMNAQTGYLGVWKNSAGNVVGYVTVNGSVSFLNLNTANQYVRLDEAASGGALKLRRQTSDPADPGSNTGVLAARADGSAFKPVWRSNGDATIFNLVRSGTITRVESLTAAAYAALTPDPATIYCLTDVKKIYVGSTLLAEPGGGGGSAPPPYVPVLGRWNLAPTVMPTASSSIATMSTNSSYVQPFWLQGGTKITGISFQNAGGVTNTGQCRLGLLGMVDRYTPGAVMFDAGTAPFGSALAVHSRLVSWPIDSDGWYGIGFKTEGASATLMNKGALSVFAAATSTESDNVYPLIFQSTYVADGAWIPEGAWQNNLNNTGTLRVKVEKQ